MFKTFARAIRRTVMSALIGLSMVSAWHLTAMAQTSPQIAQGSYDEATIQSFVKAAREVVALRKKYEPQLQATETKEAAQTLVDEARALMNEAIEREGFTVDEYTAIAKTAQADPTLRARAEAMVQAPQ